MREWRLLSKLLRLMRKRLGLSSEVAVAGEATSEADEAVVQERQRVAKELEARGGLWHGLLLSNVSKTFVRRRCCGCAGRAQVVRSVLGVSVGVPVGECFGLLCVNGAGKTTTMRMITGDIDLGGGDAFLGGWSVRGNSDRARRHLGYCPQFDALPDLLTTRETLVLYARLRGVPPSHISETVDAIIQRMCLEAHQHRLTQHLSGGNKRKLSTALALIGEPDVVLLDEPSTGIDVGARRFLWDVLGEIRTSGHALVLTSHSMDECEVLCTRLTIMVSGEFRCLGSPMQLKSMYGGGYTLMVKAQTGSTSQAKMATADENDEFNCKVSDPCAQIRAFMAESLPGANLAEENVGLFRYRLGGGRLDRKDAKAEVEQVRLADVFTKVEGAMQPDGALRNAVSDYTLSQTSLEEVFLYFSQQQAAEGSASP